MLLSWVRNTYLFRFYFLGLFLVYGLWANNKLQTDRPEKKKRMIEENSKSTTKTFKKHLKAANDFLSIFFQIIIVYN